MQPTLKPRNLKTGPIQAGEVIIKSQDMNSLMTQGVQKGGKDGGKGFSFSCLHLRQRSTVKGDRGLNLHIVGPHVQHPPAGFLYQGERFGHKVFERCPGGGAGLEILAEFFQRRIRFPGKVDRVYRFHPVPVFPKIGFNRDTAQLIDPGFY